MPVLEAADALDAAGLPPRGIGTAAGMPPHITVLFPFVDAEAVDDTVHDGLRSIAADAQPFDLALRGTGRFPGVLYLAPDRATPFVELTRAVEARWPGHPPYGGAYDAVIPHLTVCEGEEEPPGFERRIDALLPVHACADELWLMAERRDGSWERLAAFALGGDA